MSHMNRRAALKLAVGGTAMAVGVAARADDGRPPQVHRVELHNFTDRDASVTLVGAEKSFGSRVAKAWEAFELGGGSELPSGEYIYVVRTAAREVVAYGKLTINKAGPLWIRAGVDSVARKNFLC